MHQLNAISVMLAVVACGCEGGGRTPSAGAPATRPTASAPLTVPTAGAHVIHPTVPGHYRSGDWDYEYQVWGDPLKHANGTLKYEGKEVWFPMGAVLTTPLGTFMSFDVQGQQGYNTGWLMTVYLHDMERSNVVAPVFLPDGTVNPSGLGTLPIRKDAVKIVRWPPG